MKKLCCFVCLSLCVTFFCTAGGMTEKHIRGNEKNEMSYALGMILATDMAERGYDLNYIAFIRGFREAMEKEKALYSIDEAMEI